MWNYTGIEGGFATLTIAEVRELHRVVVSVSLVGEGDELDTEMFATDWFEDRDKVEVGLAKGYNHLVHGEVNL